jgi:O-antigen/teichoic acid export membrane protein
VSGRVDIGAALTRGIVGTAGLRAAQAVLALLTAVVLARLLAPEGYGAYSFAMAIVAFLAIPSELGVPGLAVREIAVANARGDWPRMRAFIAWSHRNVAAVSLVVVLATALVLFLARDRIDGERLACLWLGLLLVPLVSLGALRSAMLQGLKRVVLGQMPEFVVRPAVFLGLIGLLLLSGRVLESASGAMALQIVAIAVSFSVGLLLFARHRPAGLRVAERAAVDGLWWRSAIAFGMFAAMRLVNGRTDVLALGLFQDDAEVGIYRVAVQLATSIIFGLQIVNPIQGPHLAHIYAAGDMQAFQRVVTRTSRIVFAITVPAVCAVVLFGKPIIALVFGSAYEGAYLPLVILAAGQLVNASMGSVGSVLNMTGHERDTVRSLAAGAAVNVALNLLLTPQMGMMGAAAATSASLVTWNLLMWRQVRARLDVETSVFGGKRRWTPES